MEWISSLQFESFRAWFFVFRTDDYRVFASICVLGVASLLLFYLAPNDALLNGKKTYDTKKRIYQSGLVLHFALCVCDFDYSLVVCTDFGCDRHGCNTCLRKMGRQLLSSGNGSHNAEKAARLFVAWSGRNCCRIGIALCYPGGK